MPDSLRILMLTSDFPPLSHGGIGPHVEQLTAELRKLGHRVDVLTPSASPVADPPELGGRTIRVRIPGAPLNLASPANRIETTFRLAHENFGLIEAASKLEGPYDIVHCHDFLSIHGAVSAKKRFGVPLVLTKHFVQSPETLRDPSDQVVLAEMAYNLTVQSYAVRQADSIIAVADWVKETIMAREVGLKEGKEIRTIRSGLNPSFLEGSGPPRRSNRAVPLAIGYVGRLTHGKGCDLLLDAVHLSEMTDYSLTFTGEGVLRPELEAKARSYGIQDRVFFRGRLIGSDLVQAYDESDVVVVPSRIDTSPIVVREAQARRRPVIASDASGIGEIVSHDVDGISFPSTDVTALARSLEFAEKYPNRMSALAAAGYARATAEYGWASVATETVSAYDEARSNQVG